MKTSDPCFALASWCRGGTTQVSGSAPRALEGEFLVYSVTKMVIAALVMRLVDQRRLDLDAPAADHVAYPELGPGISVRHLLSHTAGLPDYGGLKDYHDRVRSHPAEPWSAAVFRARTLGQPRLFAPGQGWAYSNAGYMVLKDLLEAMHGRALREVVAAEIAAPLALSRFRVVDAPAGLRTLVPASSALLSTDGLAHDVASRYHPGWVAHGVIASTALEVVAFARELLDGRIVSRDALAEMMKLRRVPGDHAPWREPSYGLGLMGDPAFPAGPVYGHSGGGPGYTASVFARWDGSGPARVECALCAGEKQAAEQLVLERIALAQGRPD